MAFFLPLLAIAAAGAGGGILGSLLGGGKKEIHAQKEHYAPVYTHAPATVRQYAPTYQYQIESPGAEMVSKKALAASASAEPDVSSAREERDVEGVDMTTIAIIGVVGLVAYGLVSKPSGGRR